MHLSPWIGVLWTIPVQCAARTVLEDRVHRPARFHRADLRRDSVVVRLGVLFEGPGDQACPEQYDGTEGDVHLTSTQQIYQPEHTTSNDGCNGGFHGASFCPEYITPEAFRDTPMKG